MLRGMDCSPRSKTCRGDDTERHRLTPHRTGDPKRVGVPNTVPKNRVKQPKMPLRRLETGGENSR